MYNEYLEDKVSINSEFIYETILIESDNRKGVLQKIKEIWNKLCGFIKKIKNIILNLIRKNKNNIVNSKKEVEYTDYSETIEKCKELLNSLKNNKNDYKDHNPRGFSDREDKVLKDTKENAIKKLEKWLVEMEQIANNIRKEVDRIVSQSDTNNMNNMMKNSELQTIASRIQKIVNEIQKSIEVCIKQANGEFETSDKRPSSIKQHEIEKLYTSVESARKVIINVLINPYEKVDSVAYIINLAKKEYGDKLFEDDKTIDGEDKYIYGFTTSNVTDLSILTDYCMDARSILMKNFSEKKVNSIKGKVQQINTILRSKKDK